MQETKAHRESKGPLGVCFVGAARNSEPLDSTARKKFRVLERLGPTFVIGFSSDRRFRRFDEHARFYLMPELGSPWLRYLEFLVLGTVFAGWLALRGRAQVFVAQSPYEGLAALCATRIARIAGRRAVLVVESHGDFEVSVFLQRAMPFAPLLDKTMRRVAALVIARADVLRAISTSTKEQLERWAPGRPVLQFPTWTDREAFDRVLVETIEKDPQAVLYVGVLVPRKGIDVLIEAFALLAPSFPRASLRILGSPDNASYARSLREQAAGLGVADRISFEDAIPQEAVARRMRQAAVMVLPSLSEALGRVVLEAMWTETPVIGSRVGGIAELIEDQATGFLVSPRDVRALADRLRWVFENPSAAREMGVRGRALADGAFSGERWEAGYREILSQAEPALAAPKVPL